MELLLKNKIANKLHSLSVECDGDVITQWNYQYLRHKHKMSHDVAYAMATVHADHGPIPDDFKALAHDECMIGMINSFNMIYKHYLKKSYYEKNKNIK